MAAASLEHRLRLGAAGLGLEIRDPDLERFARYADLLIRWNRRIDLTTVDTPEGIVDRHFLDSLAIVPHLPADVHRVIDIGSGAGLPGLPIALVRPDLEVTLVEPRHKRAAFLRTVLAEIGCAASVLGKRGEDLVGDPLYDLGVSRATLPPPAWLALGRQLARHIAVWTPRATQLPATRRIPYHLPDGFHGVIEMFSA